MTLEKAPDYASSCDVAKQLMPETRRLEAGELASVSWAMAHSSG